MSHSKKHESAATLRNARAQARGVGYSNFSSPPGIFIFQLLQQFQIFYHFFSLISKLTPGRGSPIAIDANARDNVARPRTSWQHLFVDSSSFRTTLASQPIGTCPQPALLLNGFFLSKWHALFLLKPLMRLGAHDSIRAETRGGAFLLLRIARMPGTASRSLISSNPRRIARIAKPNAHFPPRALMLLNFVRQPSPSHAHPRAPPPVLRFHHRLRTKRRFPDHPRGGRVMPSVERIQDVRSPNLDVSTEKETTSSFPLESLTWGCQKARGADGKRAPRVNVVVGKAALMNPNPQPFDFIAASQRARQTSVNPDSPGFTCLLQLADAGVQLEKRRATAWGRKTKPNANATRGGGKPTQVTTKENGAAVKKKTATKSLKQPTTRSDDVSERDSDDELSDVGETRHKKRGRGPNKVRMTDEEREAKRRRRVQANRESARQTIRKKHEQYHDLNGKVVFLEASNAELRLEMTTVFERMRGLAEQNKTLREDVTAAARKKGVPAPDMGDGAVARACAKETAPVIAHAPSRTTHAGLVTSAVPRKGLKQSVARVSGTNTKSLVAPPVATAAQPSAPPPFVDGVTAALGGLAGVPAAPANAHAVAAQNHHVVMWGPFANFASAMAEAARQTGGAPVLETADANAPPATGATVRVPGAVFFGNGAAPIWSDSLGIWEMQHVPFFHPTMALAAPGAFGWPNRAPCGPLRKSHGLGGGIFPAGTAGSGPNAAPGLTGREIWETQKEPEETYKNPPHATENRRNSTTPA